MKTRIYATPAVKGLTTCANPYLAIIIYLNFQPLEVVSRYWDPQPQVIKITSYLFNLRSNICK